MTKQIFKMASVEMNVSGEKKIPKTVIREMDKREYSRLRDAGLGYVSRSGKVIPAKSQSDVLCQCPQHCGDKIPQDVRNNLFAQFYKMADHELQNDFLQAHIETMAVRKQRRRDRLVLNEPNAAKSQRRMSCRYLIPLLADPKIAIKPGRNPGTRTVEVCQKAYMHVFAITEKRIRLQREKIIAQAKAEQHEDEVLDLLTEEDMCAVRQETVAPVPDFEVFRMELDRDVAIVNNFFINQLWKPEYVDF